MRCELCQWVNEDGEKFPNAIDLIMYAIATVMRCQKLIKYHSKNRWRLPKFNRIKIVAPEIRWHELCIGRYGFSWIREVAPPRGGVR